MSATAAAAVSEQLQRAHHGLVDRETLLELVVLCAVAEEHLLVVGPPGTAKSAAVRRIADRLGGSYFEYLVGRFTEPNELFGPIDLRKLKDGVVETQTAGMLPEADFVFLDEVFHGSTAILNTLLGVLNDRVFLRGRSKVRCPLRVCVGATNHLPDDESLAAFADRFLVRHFVEPISDSLLESMLLAGRLEAPRAEQTHLPSIDALIAVARGADLSGVVPIIADCVRRLRASAIVLSDRRCVRAQKLVAAACALAGRERATPADLWPLVFVVPSASEQDKARQVLKDAIAEAENATLPFAAAAASLGVLARVEPMLRAAEAVLALTGDPSRTLKIEGLLRDIDATFAAEARPKAIVTLRESLQKALA